MLLLARRLRALLSEPSLPMALALRPRMRADASLLRSSLLPRTEWATEGLEEKRELGAAAALAPGRAARRARASSGDSRAVCGLALGNRGEGRRGSAAAS